ncbi:hypothetical protein HALLA_18735 [Halostagnicola larsenii XH-48]|uniref:Uncharacterized protein n=1 Tax=Halostagnicola larsenii XH-48 TaxID=797299 RepID=W0JR11_9EURY|nr:hypothetical protein [Halostagnicola larsenii]AHG01171.1 hypothetical protein HALLA_18735 [Halostagnicola larsenii XH-48]
MDRQLEYDKGPAYDTGPAVDEQEDGTDSDDASRSDDDPGRGESGLVESAGRSSRVGLGFGVGSFVAVYAVLYHLIGTMFATGLFTAGEQEPSRWVITGISMLVSHGATMLNGEEPVQTGYSIYTSLSSHLTALVPVVVLSIAGYLLVRTLWEASLEETVRNSAIAGMVCTASYVVLSVVLATISIWDLEGESGGTASGAAGTGEAEAITVAVDSSLVLTTAGTVLTFTLLGGAVAVFISHYVKPAEPGCNRAAESAQSESDEVSS